MPPVTYNQPVNLISYLAVRRAIGLLGLGLPVILITGTSLANFSCPLQPSISDYYYTNMGTVFAGILCAVATFLFTYKGFDNDKRFWQIFNDNNVTNIAAICALLVACFPDGEIYTPANSVLPITKHAVNTIHYTAAASLFIFLGIMSFFFFTTTEKDIHSIENPKEKTPRKIIRNNIYRTCAVIMWIAVVSIPVVVVCFKNSQCLIVKYYTIVGETIALLAFGFSWLIKGETLFKDK